MRNGGKEGKKNLGSSQRERMGMIDIDKAMAETKTLAVQSAKKKKKLLPCITTAFSMLLWIVMKISYWQKWSYKTGHKNTQGSFRHLFSFCQ